MRAGRLNKLVSFEARPATQVPGGSGDQSTWAPWGTPVYAEVVPLSGREIVAAAALQNVATHHVRIRYLSGLTAQHRMTFDGRYFNIISPPRNTDERNAEMVFEVQEGLKDG